MRLLGLLGGMSWESTSIYYRLLNESVRARLGALHSARLLLWSFDFAEIAKLQACNDWNGLTTKMVTAAENLRRGGAEALVLCTNTMHKTAPAISKAVAIPLIHIADATGFAIRSSNCSRPVLLGTRFTMEQSFYVDYLRDVYDIDPIIPDEHSRHIIHQVIYDELCRGIIRSASKQTYLQIIDRLRTAGADSVIFGCTEITLLLSQSDFAFPVFDTTQIHVQAALDFALSRERYAKG